ncbi:FecR family protein [Paraflavitalea speifideaquila]|uniref:FecR family protein n=1 Tax=Paraflavitalea speifideaquila TaxID=3076558 RepID=UPI0028E8A3BF|nr:FecR domain-containing protein [Paraflavitalea speifideiaquila]
MKYSIDELIIKYLFGALTDEERLILNEWKTLPENRQLLDQLSNAAWVKQELHKIAQVKEDNVYNKLFQIYSQQQMPVIIHKKRRTLSRYLVAASLLIVLGTATWLLVPRTPKPVSPAIVVSSWEPLKNDVQPGRNRAMVTLGDNTVIDLDSTSNGFLSQQRGARIIKQQNGEITYEKQPLTQQSETVFNTITTPKGGQYMISLPDGSKAWLNSTSSLRFPTAFTGEARIVELTGEGYFEISSLPASPARSRTKQPFLVKTGDLTVEVMGTHFNVNAYKDEEAIKTTLLEGAVKVSKGSMVGLLRPGQQSQAYRQGPLKTVKKADLEQTIAWHNGVFAFKDASILTIMRQAQRWYNIEVIYEGKVNNKGPKSYNFELPHLKP